MEGRGFFEFLTQNDRFAQFMGTSLDLMQVECRPAYSRLCELAQGRQVRLSVDGEEVA